MEKLELSLTDSDRWPADPGAAGLGDTEAEVRRAAFRSIRKGRSPDASELAAATGSGLEAVKEAVDSLVRRGEAVADGAGRVVASAGLSLAPTRHRLRLGEDQFHTWCAVDAVGIPAALGEDAVATTACPACGRPIEVQFEGGRAAPDPELVAWLPVQDCCASVVDDLCPDMNLFCNEEHLEEWRRGAGRPAGTALSLEETEELGRRWWGELT